MKKIIFALVLLVSTVFAQSALAAVFNFADIADNPLNPNYVAPGEYGAPSMSFSDGGLSVVASGSNVTGTKQYNAYLDSGKAGIGVCKELNASKQCKPSSDDNVTVDERINLLFDTRVKITDLWFVNGGHNKNFYANSEVDISIDGGSYVSYALVNLFTTDLTGTFFSFANTNADSTNPNVFYINSMNVSAVPVPAAVWLFGSALLGLTGISRRKNQASLALAA